MGETPRDHTALFVVLIPTAEPMRLVDWERKADWIEKELRTSGHDDAIRVVRKPK